ncbi:alpha/beta-Hydrolase [Glarea lozoyensis ATCC 20868]|uniref:1-alkyl-2-acetylglycerophosphocholine esterase n=1 Tax=Glarea lozoyensis (strain ATCC 20868 / MF5171) TaxID=1116229 RepID=S3E2S3_GLAL2|nr:alpha/beta-Hydrolase [Glarea lozoyensis ATCC 20868]EPE32738.1 alpha/beta-Hydrolase [Glarea lozoyensis ATCC 20868]
MHVFILFALLNLTTGILLPPPRGPHPITYTTKSLTDHTRWDTLAPTEKQQKRRILISIFSPLEITNDTCQPEILPYLPSATASQYNLILDSLGVPNYILDGFELQFCKQPLQQSSEDYPVIIFSPGFTTSRLLSSVQARDLASHGFVVITVDHPYDATIVEFPGGEVVYGFNITDVLRNELAENMVEVRAADISYLINQLPNLHSNYNQSKVFVYGHSLGGATAALAASLDSRVLGGLDFDGTIYGSVNDTGLDKPIVLAGRPIPEDTTEAELYDGFYDRLRGEKMLIVVNGTQHMSFCDAPFLVSLRDDIPEELSTVMEAVVGSIGGNKLAGILDELLVSTASFVFGGDASGMCRIDDTNDEMLVLEEELPC